MRYACVQASLAPLLQERYGLTILKVGFCYLAFGIATAIASYGVGRITDFDHRQTAIEHNLSIDRVRGDDLLKFPIEKARLRTAWLYIFVSATATAIYGWTLEYHMPLADLLTMQFLIGLAVTATFNVFGTLITDLNSSQATTASAAVSITRCSAAAAGVSVLQLYGCPGAWVGFHYHCWAVRWDCSDLVVGAGEGLAVAFRRVEGFWGPAGSLSLRDK